MIDLARFSKPTSQLAPIVGGWGMVNGRRIWDSTAIDNWYLLEIGDRIKKVRAASPLQVLTALASAPNTLRVYSYGTEAIPCNFGNAAALGVEGSVNINFLNLGLFTIAKVVLWDDNRFYFYEEDPKFQRTVLQTLKKRFEASQAIDDVKDVNPELAYYFLLASLERAAYRSFDSIINMRLPEAEKKKRLEQFKNTFEERTRHEIELAGGRFVSIEKSNATSYLVTWRIGNQTVKSTVRDNLEVLSLGYCASGADRDHSLTSAVQLAKLFREDRPLHITRE